VKNTDELVGRLARISDDDLRGAADRPAARSLLDQVTAAARQTPARPRRSLRSRLVLSTVAAAFVAGATGVAIGPPWDNGQVTKPTTVNAAAVLEIQHHGKIYTVYVKDAFADPQQYAEEFKRAGLTVELTIVPVSPSKVRQLAAVSAGDPAHGEKDGGTTSVYDYPVKCPPGKNDCPLGLRISTDRPLIPIEVLLGRKARPGEVYDASGRGDATGKGEVLAGAHVRQRTVGDVRAMLDQRHVSIAGYQIWEGDSSAGPVPASQIRASDRVWRVESNSSTSVVILVERPAKHTG
jgi:hypothetical protein